jgi:hypothetical protein
MSREAIYEALLAQITGAVSFNTVSRRWKVWNDVAPADQPALFQNQKGERTEIQGRGLPPKRYLLVDLCIYATSGDPNSPPSSRLNPLIDAVEAALAPDPFTGVQTLGGMVSHCEIKGQTEIAEGVLGNQAIVIIPVEILIP